jgi:molybdate transport system ATP-binding protein
VTREDLPIGKPARVEIMAKDVSLALKSHADTSIINILPAEVIGIEDINPSQALVRLQLSDGKTLLSRITRRSAMSLNLEIGQRLFAQIKSVALIS